MDANRARLQIFSAIVLATLGLLSLRLVQLQLVQSDIYSVESQKNSVHPRIDLPARGLIYDRNGTLLVSNEPAYSLTVTPRFFDTENIPLLARLLNVPDSLVEARISEARSWSPYKPSRVFREIPFSSFSRVLEYEYKLPGIDFVIDEKRRYHPSVNAAHALGYVKEISRKQLDQRKTDGYRLGDPLGQTGIESVYESELRGQLGQRFVMVNVHGQEVKSYMNGNQDIPPQSGHSLHLTLDANLQAFAETLFVNKRGAAVALDPNNGEILALISAPDYNPELLSGTVNVGIWKGLQRDENKPLFNRASLSVQPPGSTFKPFMALVALQEGAITPQTSFHCSGVFYLGSHPYRCMKAHGSLTVVNALKRSCNVFFYNTMMRLNFARWSEWGRTFGFGGHMPTDLPEQSSGIFPDSAYFNRVYPKGWTRGYLVSLGIGQGNLTISPLQLVRYVSAVANGGKLHTPHLLREIAHPETGERTLPELPTPKVIPIQAEYFDLVREGMRRMVMENNSTVKWGDVVAAGKTGTSQNPHGKDHSWFMGFAPFDDPQIALAVFVENGGFGASAAAPIGGLMMEQYLTGKTDQHPAWVREMALRASSTGMGDDTIDWGRRFEAGVEPEAVFVPTAHELYRTGENPER